MIHRLENSVFYDLPHYFIISTSLHRIGWYKYLNVKDQIVKQELYISLSVCGAFAIGNMQISPWCVLWLLKNSRELGCQMGWCHDLLMKYAVLNCWNTFDIIGASSGSFTEHRSGRKMKYSCLLWKRVTKTKGLPSGTRHTNKHTPIYHTVSSLHFKTRTYSNK